MYSLQSIETLVQQYTADLDSLPQLPPVVAELKLNQVDADLVPLKLGLSHHHKKKQYASVDQNLKKLQFKLHQLQYETRRALHSTRAPALKEPTPIKEPEPEKEDNVTELRKRLLTNSSLLDKPDKLNDYHESFQEDLLSDLTNLASDLRQGAINLSMRLLDDKEILHKAADNLNKNESMMDIVGNNLNNYVSNKTGGKISFWFLLKVMVGVFTLFFVMIIIIKILPRM